MCVCVCFLGEEVGTVEAERVSERGMEGERWMKAVGVLIILCSVVGSELAISPRLYPSLMIWAVPLFLSPQLLWPNKEKGRAKMGFYNSNYATLTINIPQSPLCFEQSNPSTVTLARPGGEWIWLLQCRLLLHHRGQIRSSLYHGSKAGAKFWQSAKWAGWRSTFLIFSLPSLLLFLPFFVWEEEIIEMPSVPAT